MKIRFLKRVIIEGKVYEAGEEVSAPPLKKETSEKILRLVKRRPELAIIVRDQKAKDVKEEE